MTYLKRMIPQVLREKQAESFNPTSPVPPDAQDVILGDSIRLEAVTAALIERESPVLV